MQGAKPLAGLHLVEVPVVIRQAVPRDWLRLVDAVLACDGLQLDPRLVVRRACSGQRRRDGRHVGRARRGGRLVLVAESTMG
ncbi:hypothetical protein GCM10027589_59010 [Actinocorallia lasiicapitis]